MKYLARIVIFFVVVLSCSVFYAQTRSSVPVKSADSVAVKTVQDTTLTDTVAQDTCYHPLRLIPDSILNPNRPYNKNAFKFRYDAFKEQMKNPWIADALREILTR